MRVLRMVDVIRVQFNKDDCEPAYRVGGATVPIPMRVGEGAFDFAVEGGDCVGSYLPIPFSPWEASRLREACRIAAMQAVARIQPEPQADTFDSKPRRRGR